jgi:hypothetical protein
MASVRTLRQAHELLHREWPGNSAPASAWLAYHQRAAKLYAHVAQVDKDHHHEALHWVTQEEEQVRILTEMAEHRTSTGGTNGR